MTPPPGVDRAVPVQASDVDTFVSSFEESQSSIRTTWPEDQCAELTLQDLGGCLGLQGVRLNISCTIVTFCCGLEKRLWQGSWSGEEVHIETLCGLFCY